ncbi:DUF2752 domain-containing protein [Flavobacterium sp.]|uniref:DUF2752 domain-containing protein n=1 Tax=Flavobacterium sp. TaxID=239 RepID=UPI003BC18EA6
MEEYFLPCIFKKMFGIDCIGCGIQRSINFILNGEFAKAFTVFPAIYTTIIFFLVVAFYLIDPKHRNSKMVVFFAISNAIIMITSYVYKMKFLF